MEWDDHVDPVTVQGEAQLGIVRDHGHNAEVGESCTELTRVTPCSAFLLVLHNINLTSFIG